MSRIKGKNTKPELEIRTELHKRGYRFRLNGKASKAIFKNGLLPGKPDIVLKKFKTCVFVHGCFWHNHENCKRATLPKTNKKYWIPKIKRNKERDKTNKRVLEKLGWKVLIIWECQMNTRTINTLFRKLNQRKAVIEKGN